jgi:hypothetical protein
MGCDPHECTLACIYQSISCDPLKLSWCSAGCEQDLEFDKIQTIMDFAFAGAERSLEEYLGQWSIASLLTRLNKSSEERPEQVSQQKIPVAVRMKEEIERHINKIGGEG